jgi:hypothetical protein
METPQNPLSTEEQKKIAEIEKQRTLSDAELLKSGAQYLVDTKGNKRLDLTDVQIAEAQKMSPDEMAVEKVKLHEVTNIYDKVAEVIGEQNQDLVELKLAIDNYAANNYSGGRLMNIIGETCKLLSTISVEKRREISEAMNTIIERLYDEKKYSLAWMYRGDQISGKYQNFYITKQSPEHDPQYEVGSVIDILSPAFIDENEKLVGAKGWVIINRS